MLPRSRENSLATAAILLLGPTRIGLISPASPASTAPLSEVSSQGCATAVATACCPCAAVIRRSYFSCRRNVDAVALSFMTRSSLRRVDLKVGRLVEPRRSQLKLREWGLCG